MKNQILTHHIISTEDASHLYISDKLYFDSRKVEFSLDDVKNQHIYLCSDAEIKVDDWMLRNDNTIIKATEFTGKEERDASKKIEFTTDLKLWDKMETDRSQRKLSHYLVKGVPAINENTKARVLTYNSKGEVDGGWYHVNFLSEFCKRYNERDNQKDENGYNPYKRITAYIRDKFGAQEALAFHIKFAQPVIKDNQKEGVDAEGLAEKEFPYSDFQGKRVGIDDEHTGQALRGAYVAGFEKCQALQSNAGQFSSEDMENFVRWRDNYLDDDKVGWRELQKRENQNYREHLQIFIQSLAKEQPKDIVIGVEMEEDFPIPEELKEDFSGLSKRIKLNKEGQPTLIFK